MPNQSTSHAEATLLLRHKCGMLASPWQYLQRQCVWPDVLRWRGSILLPTLPAVAAMSGFSCLIVVLHLNFKISMGIPVFVLSTVSVALGLLLAFRVNTAYDRYWEGRKLFQTVMATIRNLARQVWINIPEETQRDYLEKMRCIKLLLAFMVATKHHLRHEYGTDYYDLEVLLPPGWRPCSAKAQTSDLQGLRKRRVMIDEAVETATNKIKRLPLVTAFHDSTRPDSHDQPMESDAPNDVANIRRSLVQKHCPDWEIGQASVAQIQRHAFYRQETSFSTSTSTIASTLSSCDHHQGQFTSEEDLPLQGDADMSLPLEILFRIALYIHQAKTANKVESQFVSVMTASLDTLANSLTAFERIVHTPIPKAYNIHLKQGIVFYNLFLPLTLVDALGWLVVPVVALVSFTLFGIEAIGAEIENPFGYDENDLPLNRYCEELKKEVEYIIYHIPTHSTSILLDGQ